MVAGIICMLVGALCIIFGIFNACGNISSLHYYHRKNVKEEDKKPFGRRVGAGTIIVGTSVLALGACMLLAEILSMPVLVTVGSISMTAGLIIGLIITVWAIKKYNKTIF